MAKTNAWGFSESDKKADRKLAIPTLVRNVQGTVSTVYVDAKTGNEVTDFKDYEIYDQYTEDRRTLGLLPEEEKKKAGEATKTEVEKRRQLEVDDRRNDQNHTYGSTKATKRTDQNNFGYTDRPAAVSWASALPGPMGLAGKAVNTALNVNNTVAANRARSFLGLDTKTNVKGMLSDEKGYIGDINYNGVTSPVGFEAETKDGRTTLTPTEARMRAQLSGIKEATPKEKRANEKAFEKENPNARGLIGRFTNAISAPVKDAVAGVQESLHTPSSKSTTGTLSQGLGDLSPSFNRGVNYDHVERGPVTQGLNPRTVEMMDALATNEPGGINVTSAHRTKAQNAAVDGAKKSLHISGDAIDVSTRGMTEQQKRDFVERSIMSGAMEMGTYSNGSLHLASTQRVAPKDAALTGGVTAMHNKSRDGYANAPGWYKDGIEVSRLAATPTEKPANPASNGFARVDLGKLFAEPASVAANSSLPAGMRNNNPGNLKYSGSAFQRENFPGLVGPSTNTDQGDFQAVFDSPENGMKAASRLAQVKYDGGKLTANDMIAGENGWTPGNLQAAKNIAASMGIGPDEDLGLNDPARKAAFVRALVTQEHGPASKAYTDDMISAAIGKQAPTTALGFMGTPNPANNFGYVSPDSGFGQNLGQTKQNLQSPTSTPRTFGAGAGVQASASLNLSKPDDGYNSKGMMSAENANRATSKSTPTGGQKSSAGLAGTNTGGFSDRSSAGKSSVGGYSSPTGTKSSSSLSSSTGSTGGFGVGGDRSSTGKSSVGGYSGSSLSTSKGSTGGFGVGGDRSSSGKSTSSSSSSKSSSQSKGAASRSDGWS